MWVAILGAPGTMKEAVAERVAKDLGFVIEREEPPLDLFEKAATNPVWFFELQLEFLVRRHRLQADIAKRSREENILQIRSYWDTTLVYNEVLAAAGYLSVDQRRYLDVIDAALSPYVAVPDAVIYLYGSKMLAADRSALQGKRFNEDDGVAVAAAYADMVKKIRVPVIDVETRDDFEAMIGEVNAGLDAARVSGGTQQTVWVRSFLR